MKNLTENVTWTDREPMYRCAKVSPEGKFEEIYSVVDSSKDPRVCDYTAILCLWNEPNDIQYKIFKDRINRYLKAYGFVMVQYKDDNTAVVFENDNSKYSPGVFNFLSGIERMEKENGEKYTADEIIDSIKDYFKDYIIESITEITPEAYAGNSEATVFDGIIDKDGKMFVIEDTTADDKVEHGFIYFTDYHPLIIIDKEPTDAQYDTLEYVLGKHLDDTHYVKLRFSPNDLVIFEDYENACHDDTGEDYEGYEVHVAPDSAGWFASSILDYLQERFDDIYLESLNKPWDWDENDEIDEVLNAKMSVNEKIDLLKNLLKNFTEDEALDLLWLVYSYKYRKALLRPIYNYLFKKTKPEAQKIARESIDKFKLSFNQIRKHNDYYPNKFSNIDIDKLLEPYMHYYNEVNKDKYIESLNEDKTVLQKAYSVPAEAEIERKDFNIEKINSYNLDYYYNKHDKDGYIYFGHDPWYTVLIGLQKGNLAEMLVDNYYDIIYIESKLPIARKIKFAPEDKYLESLTEARFMDGDLEDEPYQCYQVYKTEENYDVAIPSYLFLNKDNAIEFCKGRNYYCVERAYGYDINTRYEIIYKNDYDKFIEDYDDEMIHFSPGAEEKIEELHTVFGDDRPIELRNAIAKDLNTSIENANKIMTGYLGFTDEDIYDKDIYLENLNESKIVIEEPMTKQMIAVTAEYIDQDNLKDFYNTLNGNLYWNNRKYDDRYQLFDGWSYDEMLDKIDWNDENISIVFIEGRPIIQPFSIVGRIEDGDTYLENLQLDEKIVKLSDGKWQVQSEKGRNMGTYNTKKEAEDRLKEVEMFKHMNEKLLIEKDLTDSELEQILVDAVHSFKTKKEAIQYLLKVFPTVYSIYRDQKRFNDQSKRKYYNPEGYVDQIDGLYNYLMFDDKIRDSDLYRLTNHGWYKGFNRDAINYKELYNFHSKEDNYVEKLSEELLLEKTRNQLIDKSKKSDNYSKKNQGKGRNRWERRVHSHIANTVRDYNKIDMDAFFKADILDFIIKVQGETNNYEVQITFEEALREIARQVKSNNNNLEFKCVLRGLISAFNRGNVYVSCSCPDWKYRQAYWSTKGQYNSGTPQPDNGKAIANPNDTKGGGCKHVNLCLANLDWMMKIASVINNYIYWARDNLEWQYAQFIFPQIFGMPYDKAIQMTIDMYDEAGELKPEYKDDRLKSNEDIINMSNMIGKQRGQYKKKPEKSVNPRYADLHPKKEEPEEEETNELGLELENDEPEFDIDNN